ncbi:ORF6N domain-containing protein [Methylovulum psychrotolerans]|uniref:ORF6N domain-containing protein n=1 Tax=Methylovulum psychrotolerans TaxID=1704499 RepID=UPI001BFEF48B|nr:ORF6N domain-containing protein [Methylovulum psychrotolerans]MBT9097459.1 ORF6N domain-containing protein [Methylovulum psychrotolerans]
MNTQSPATPIVRVENTDIPVIIHQETRVITTELLAQVYGSESRRITENFTRNQDRFEIGKHFFKLEGEELLRFKRISPQIPKNTRNLILWTERGAARHAKMLDTDQAWDVFDKLEAAYFEQPTATPSQELPKPEKSKITRTLTTFQNGEVICTEKMGDNMRMVSVTNVEAFCDFILDIMPLEFAPEVLKALARKVIGTRVVGGV